MAIEATMTAMQFAKVTSQIVCDCGHAEFEVGLSGAENRIVLLQCGKCKKQTLTRAVGDNLRKNLI